MLKRFGIYWYRHIKHANDGFAVVMLVITGGLFIVGFGGKICDLKTPNQVGFENWCLYGAGLFFSALCFVWLPFRRYDMECQRHDETKRQIQVLEQHIADDSPKVTIKGHMQSHIKIDVFGVAVVIEAVNTGRKPAKISAVAMYREQTRSQLEGADEVKFSTAGFYEYLADMFHEHDNKHEIEPDGGVMNWAVKIMEVPHFKTVERDGKVFVLGYMRFTDGTKQEFKVPVDKEVMGLVGAFHKC